MLIGRLAVRVRDRRAEAQPDERASQTKVKSRMYASILPTERHPVAKRVMIAEANTDAPKPLRGAPDGTGYRDMARSESPAQELGRPADGKPMAGVGGVRLSLRTHTTVKSITTACIGSNGPMSAGDVIDRGKIAIIISNILAEAKKGTPRNDKRNSSGKAGCGKSARPV